jgi:GT2 family glycosyltransferase
MTTPPHRSAAGDRPTVAAVVVAHRGERWLPGLRAAVAAQTRQPDLVVAADTGGDGDRSATLADWLGPDRTVPLPPDTGFGAAVAAALERDPGPADWVWLLHDDCAPAPDALDVLLAEAAADASIAVAGPKVVGLGDRHLLLEVGVTLARSGRRETGLERREQDQGQHDGTRTVLAVGSAGLLVRRDVWDELGGFDPRLPLLRDDVDLGWRATLAGHRVVVVTDAVIAHAEATARRRRSVQAGGGRPHRLDRQHAIYVLLANLPLLRTPLVALRLTLAGLFRALGLLAGKRPGHAADEVVALVAVLARPDRLVRARLARRRTRRLPPRTALPLLAPRGAGLRHGMEGLSVFFGTRAGDAMGGRHRAPLGAVETGPTSEDAEDLPSSGAGAIRRLLLRPSVLLCAGLVLLGLVASRHLIGSGRLMGGALLPPPVSAADLWRTYLAAWHPVGLGSGTAAPPYLAALALLGNVLLGSASHAVDLVLLGAVPVSGCTAYLALRRVTSSAPLRVWGAVTYALLPSTLGAVATGRLGSAVLAMLLPVLAMTLLRALGQAAGPRAWRATWTAVLLGAVMAAFVPLAYLLVALPGLVVLAVRRDGAQPWSRVAALVLGPLVLLAPWFPAVRHRPATLLLEAGLPGPGLSVPDLDGLDVLLLHPGGPGLPPLPLTVGLLLAALAALLRPDRRRLVLVPWLIAVCSLVAAVGLSRLDLSAPAVATPVAPWPGPLMLVAGGALVVAAVAGATGARSRVAAASFGWRQPGAVLVVALAVVVPVVTGLWWAGAGAGGPLQRRDPQLLPAFVVAEGTNGARPRTLVLRAGPSGPLRYALLRSDGPRTGDAELTPDRDPTTGLDAAVADFASGRGGDAAGRLVPYGIRFVLLTPPVDAGLRHAIDAVPGVQRLSRQSGAVLWRLTYTSARVRLLPPGAPVVRADGSPPPARVVPAGQVEAHADIPAGASGRLLTLADAADGGWRATLDGHPLVGGRYDGWAQNFRVPGRAGAVALSHDQGGRPTLLWLQLGLLVLVVVLALPQAGSVLEQDHGEDADLADPVGSVDRPVAVGS